MPGTTAGKLRHPIHRELATPLVIDGRGEAVQVFAPDTQLLGTIFEVRAGATFSSLVDTTVTYNSGVSIDVSAGEVLGVPILDGSTGTVLMTVTPEATIRFAGGAGLIA